MALDPLEHVIDHPLFEGSPVSKYQVLIVAAAGLICLAYIPLARRIRNGEPPRGPFWNALEGLLFFIRNEVAKPNIGEHDADRFVPFLWTLFLFILTCNLLGMVPFLGAPTADISVTLVLAAIVFLVIHVSAIMKLGIGSYVKSFIPHLRGDNLLMNIFLIVFIVPLISVIEVLGALIRAAVLAIRLFANIFAGHVALGVILLFAVNAVDQAVHVFGGVTLATVFMGTALSMLELFVAFLQAFVFVLLTSIFLGMQLHPEH
jgi:F-type H+-transporting ATPase subunit a